MNKRVGELDFRKMRCSKSQANDRNLVAFNVQGPSKEYCREQFCTVINRVSAMCFIIEDCFSFVFSFLIDKIPALSSAPYFLEKNILHTN